MTSPVIVKGGRVELERADGRVIVAPPDHFFVHDPSGEVLDACAIYVGPAQLTDEPATDLTTDQRWYLGLGYDARVARIDVPTKKWRADGAVIAIEFFRRGSRHEGDWRHEFTEPQPLFASGSWFKVKLPKGCVITYREIELP